jgi:hypothetical protein
MRKRSGLTRMFGLVGLELLVMSSAALPAMARPTFGDCAKAVEREGYLILEMDARGSNYDIDARKGGREWDLQADRNCRILDARPD